MATSSDHSFSWSFPKPGDFLVVSWLYFPVSWNSRLDSKFLISGLQEIGFSLDQIDKYVLNLILSTIRKHRARQKGT
jgi:hypothetical protein